MALIQEIQVTVPLSGTVSDNISLKGSSGPAALFASVITSCQVLLQGSFNTTSANFVPVDRTDGSTRWAWNASVGNRGVGLKQMESFPYLKIETGVPQTAPAIFTLAVRV